jgi:hypothetical protein
MPGEDDGLTPDAAPTDAGHDHHSRIEDKRRWASDTDAEGVPAEEGVDDSEVDDRLDDDPEREGNRRDVPPTPENTLEARTRDGAEDEITRP